MEPIQKHWFEIDRVEEIASPALLVYRDRVNENILRLINRVSDPARLRPHVKTHKMAAVCRRMMEKGISKFKSATFEEAEMLGSADAPDVLIAYPLTGPNINRFRNLVQKYAGTRFSTIVDRAEAARDLSEASTAQGLIADVYIDLNVGMNRTGILLQDAASLAVFLKGLPGIRLCGLHAYDGHIKEKEFAKRSISAEAISKDILFLRDSLEKQSGIPLQVIAGGSPTYLCYASLERGEVSPGTFVFWDKGYREQLPEQPFEFAALLLSRIISIPGRGIICTDLGYKSVASENPQPRVSFLNAPEAIPFAHSEEHLTLSVPDSAIYKIGQPLYGLPWHICPSVALYKKALVVEDHVVVDEWEIARR
jgi:D-threonine aldolase